MNRCFRLALAVSAAMVLQGCDNGYNIPREDPNYAGAERTCAEAPVNANATESAVAVYNLLLRLSCTRASEGIMMGQVVGSGTVIDERSEDNSYYQLFTEFNDEFNQMPSLLTVDYGQDGNYTRETLTRVNERIKQHWNAGGVVMITWRPFNPVDPSLGTQYSEDVNMERLRHADNPAWKSRLDLVASALRELQDAGVAVLWAPLPEMNTAKHWWGVQASRRPDVNDSTLYTGVWANMRNYFTSGDRPLNNLLWVYSPGDGTSLPAQGPITGGTPTFWAYPGDNEVDVIAPVVRDDDLLISDYEPMTGYTKPVGMAEFGPQSAAEGSRYGVEETLPDETTRIRLFRGDFLANTLIGSYIYLGFWASPYSLEATDDVAESKLALGDIEGTRDLLARREILTLGRLQQLNWR